MWLKTTVEKEDYKMLFLHIIFMISFYQMNIYTPFNRDDYWYSFIYGAQELIPIENIKDVLISQYNHYYLVNGRFIPHLLEQTFAGIFGKNMFNIFNTLMFFLLVKHIFSLIFTNTPLNKRQKITIYSFIYFSALFLFTNPGQTELWMDGSLNYMWSMVLSLSIIKLYITNKSNSNITHGIIFIYAIIAGWTHEGIAIIVNITLLFSIFLNTQYKNIKNYIIISGYTIGTFLVTFAPGTLKRLSTNEAPMHGDILFLLFSKILNCFTALNNTYIFWITTTILIIHIYKKGLYNYISKNTFWFILWLLNTCFIFLLGYGEERVCYSLSIFSFILLFITYKHKLLLYFNAKNISILIISISFIGYLYAINKTHRYFEHYSIFNKEILDNQGDSIVIKLDPYLYKSRFTFIDDFYRNLPHRNYLYEKNLSQSLNQIIIIYIIKRNITTIFLMIIILILYIMLKIVIFIILY